VAPPVACASRAEMRRPSTPRKQYPTMTRPNSAIACTAADLAGRAGAEPH
jgi:hypothetical protein